MEKVLREGEIIFDRNYVTKDGFVRVLIVEHGIYTYVIEKLNGKIVSQMAL